MSEENKTEKKKGISAKLVSLIGKIVGATIIVGGAVLKWLGKLPLAEINEIITIGFCTMGVFSTIDLNIMIDKFVKKEK